MIQMGSGGGEAARWSSVVSEAVGVFRRSSECRERVHWGCGIVGSAVAVVIVGVR